MAAFAKSPASTTDWTTGSTGFNTSNVPGVGAYNGLYNVYFKDANGGGIMWINSKDGVNWGGNVYTGLNTSGGCCAIAYNKFLNVFFRASGSGDLIHAWTSSPPGWTNQELVGIQTSDAANVAVLGDMMCVVCQDNSGASSGAVMYAVTTGNGWSIGNSGFNTTTQPAIAPFKDQFYLFYQDATGVIQELVSSNGINWSGPMSTGLRYHRIRGRRFRSFAGS